MKVYALKVRPIYHSFPIVAWLIMIFQGMSPFSKKSYSHNAILFTDRYGVDRVIDSTVKGSVAISNGYAFFKRYKLIEMVEMPAPITKHLLDVWTKKIVGRKYDQLQIFGLTLKILGLISFNNFGGNYKRMTCNEVVLSYLKTFKGLEFGDSDNYDLNMTWDIVVSVNEDMK